MRTFVIFTLVLVFSCLTISAQELVKQELERNGLHYPWMVTITNGYNLGVQGSVLGTSTTRNADDQIIGISNNRGSYGTGMSPGISVDYLLNKNISVGLAGEYLIGSSITTNEDTQDGAALQSESKMQAIRVAPRVTVSSHITKRTSLFARVGVDFVLGPVINSTSNFIGDFLPEGALDPGMLPPGFEDFIPVLDNLEINTKTRGNFSPAVMLQLGAQFRFSQLLGMQVALDYRGYTFVNKSSTTEVSGLGLIGSFLSVPYLSEVNYTSELNANSNNTSVNAENVDFTAPRDELEQRFAASSLGIRVGLSVYF